MHLQEKLYIAAHVLTSYLNFFILGLVWVQFL